MIISNVEYKLTVILKHLKSRESTLMLNKKSNFICIQVTKTGNVEFICKK